MEKVSILLPTRKRFESFCKTLESLSNTCSNVKNYEVLVALDNDDTETIEQVKQYSATKTNIEYFIYERYYYRGLHKYYNDLAKRSSGTSLMLWNDDALMLSNNWDLEILNAHRGNFCALSPKVTNMEEFWNNQGMLFPVLPKQWIDITGEMSAVPSVDSWLDLITKHLDLQTKLPSVEIFHDRSDLTGNHVDENHADSRADISQGFPTQWEIFEEHKQKLSDFLSIKK